MTRAEIDRVVLWCREITDRTRGVRLEARVTGRHIDLVAHDEQDADPHWTPQPLARLLRLNNGFWTLSWRDAEGRFQVYRHLRPVPEVDDLLAFLAATADPLLWAGSDGVWRATPPRDA